MKRVISFLWWAYGYTYDGLNNFYPYKRLVGLVARRVDSRSGDVILDIGCGTGNIMNAMLGSGAKLVGVDGSASMIGMAKKKLFSAMNSSEVELFHDDILTFLRNEKSNKYDKIVSVNVIYALSKRADIWLELKRVVKPGGVMVIATSIKTGSGSIIREHLGYAPWWSLLRPRLLGVFIVDSLINLLGDKGQFEFPGQDILAAELSEIGYMPTNPELCYGGVDIVFDAVPLNKRLC